MEKYKRIKVLGKGSFGKAYLVENTEAQELCVVKQMETLMMQPKERDEAVKEAMLLKKMDHPNIVRFQEVFMTRKGRLCIVMDYADGGDVHMEIKGRQGKLIPEEQISQWFSQTCFALMHVHERKVLHRDLKTQNIFLMKSGQVKLGDFGIARVLDATKDYAKTMVGTPYYLSPEIIEDRPYNFKSDIWSLGVVLYEMTTLKHPFDAESLHFLAIKILQGQYPDPDPQYSPDLVKLIRSMLAKSAHGRPSVQEVLAYPILNKAMHETNRRYNLGIDLSAYPEQSGENTQASDAQQSRPGRGPRAAVEAARAAEEKDTAAGSTPEEADTVLIGTVKELQPPAAAAEPVDNNATQVMSSKAGKPEEDEVDKGEEEYEEEFEDYSGGSEDEGGEEQKNLAHSVANVKLSPGQKGGATEAPKDAPVAPAPMGSPVAANASAAHSAKAESLKTYLKSQMKPDVYENAYRLVRSATQDVEAGQESLQQQVGEIIGKDKEAQLFPLFQLLCFLEDVASSQKDT